eukprot:scaffold243294_cov30-Tisochrysis_lutea.AAC.1
MVHDARVPAAGVVAGWQRRDDGRWAARRAPLLGLWFWFTVGASTGHNSGLLSSSPRSSLLTHRSSPSFAGFRICICTYAYGLFWDRKVCEKFCESFTAKKVTQISQWGRGPPDHI